MRLAGGDTRQGRGVLVLVRGGAAVRREPAVVAVSLATGGRAGGAGHAVAGRRGGRAGVLGDHVFAGLLRAVVPSGRDGPLAGLCRAAARSGPERHRPLPGPVRVVRVMWIAGVMRIVRVVGIVSGPRVMGGLRAAPFLPGLPGRAAARGELVAQRVTGRAALRSPVRCRTCGRARGRDGPLAGPVRAGDGPLPGGRGATDRVFTRLVHAVVAGCRDRPLPRLYGAAVGGHRPLRGRVPRSGEAAGRVLARVRPVVDAGFRRVLAGVRPVLARVVGRRPARPGDVPRAGGGVRGHGPVARGGRVRGRCGRRRRILPAVPLDVALPAVGLAGERAVGLCLRLRLRLLP
ncbi:hypothetical protein [Streptomyces sp. XD-27]|uniref:hypothetical protein n=1 Tax=Streptomyces sp. XD-27 TaxID=3062779 RepID=UPI0026F444F4|nr:hypothetical protein [Streptomyces sp. XD-27]WKX70608.1 hypothetical protein Q3Y56_12425 [Streptomyces sp. XD-27]